MRHVYSDLWAEEHGCKYRVIPVNIGWRRNGKAVMGRGIAKQLCDLGSYDYETWWGRECMRGGEETPVTIGVSDMIFFPTKPLVTQFPFLSWRQDSSLELIERSARQLAALTLDGSSVALPLVGCGNGRLRKADVLPILERHLDDRFVLVEPELDVWLSGAYG